MITQEEMEMLRDIKNFTGDSWEIIRRQVIIDGCSNLTMAGVLGMIAAFINSMMWREDGPALSGNERTVRLVTIGVFNCVAALFIAALIYEAVTNFLNPEYTAIKKVINLLDR